MLKINDFGTHLKKLEWKKGVKLNTKKVGEKDLQRYIKIN
jgi:hypothetical protein